jgi:hypothetical protein
MTAWKNKLERLSLFGISFQAGTIVCKPRASSKLCPQILDKELIANNGQTLQLTLPDFE